MPASKSTKALEIESVWRPIKALTFGLNVGYLDSYYKDYPDPAACSPRRRRVARPTRRRRTSPTQNRPLNAPAWTVSGNATYTWDLPSGSLLARAGWDWRSFTKVANTTPSVTDQPAYGLIDAGLAFTTTGQCLALLA